MTLNTKLLLAAGSLVLICLLSLLPWGSAGEEEHSPVTIPLSATSTSKDLDNPQALSKAHALTRTPAGSKLQASADQPVDPNLDLSGIVVDAHGAPIAFADIDIYKPLHRHSSRVRPYSEPVLDIIAQMTSDSEGRFRVRLEPGRTFDLGVTAMGFGTRRLPNLYAGEFLDRATSFL